MNKYQTRNCSLQTVNHKWSWENIQCVKNFPAVLLALYKERKGDSFLISVRRHSFSRSLPSRFRRQNEYQYRSPRLPPFCSASIREGWVALSVGHPRGTYSRYLIGCCLIPPGICGLKNNLETTYLWNRSCMGDAFSVPFILSCYNRIIHKFKSLIPFTFCRVLWNNKINKLPPGIFSNLSSLHYL